MGAVVGGVTTAKLGGYNTVGAQKLQYYLALCATASAIPIPFVDSFILTVILAWLLIFFGGAILPTATGIMINTVKPN